MRKTALLGLVIGPALRAAYSSRRRGGLDGGFRRGTAALSTIPELILFARLSSSGGGDGARNLGKGENSDGSQGELHDDQG